jgi:exodeoxyribonuclease VII large subunit
MSKERQLVRSLRDQCAADTRRSLTPHADTVCRLHEALLQDAGRALRRERRAILDMRTAAATAARQEARQAEHSLVETTGDFTALVRRNLDALAEVHEDTSAGVAAQANRVIGQNRKLLGHLSDLAQAYDPVHVLRRGFSITLNVEGKAVKSAAELAPGETIITRLASGQIASTITRMS